MLLYFFILFFCSELLALLLTLKLMNLNYKYTRIIWIPLIHSACASLISTLISKPYDIFILLIIAILLVQIFLKKRLLFSLILAVFQFSFHIFAFNIIFALRNIFLDQLVFFEVISSFRGFVSLILPYIILFYLSKKYCANCSFLKNGTLKQIVAEQNTSGFLWTIITIAIENTLLMYYLTYNYVFNINPGQEYILLFSTLLVFSISLFIINKVFNLLQNEVSYSEVKEKLNYLTDINLILENQKHDFKQHLQLLMALIQLEKYDRALEYMRNITDHLEELKKVTNTGITALDSLLIYKNTLTKRDNIDLMINVSTRLSQLPLDDTAICRVIGNLLDNAIEYLKGKQEIKKYIELNIQEMDEKYLINVSNPIENADISRKNVEQLLLRGNSTKGEGRGLGLSIINDIISNTGGKVEPILDNKKGILTFNLIIPKKIISERYA